MKVFDNYAHYYDLLYRDKDYRGETDYICGLLEKFAPGAKSILDLGCGTGRHAVSLAERGFDVFGVDLSKKMIAKAGERKTQLSSQVSQKVNFEVADIRKLNVGKNFDVIVSLFHVLSYQTTDEDLQATFEVVAEHLEPEGIFIFDFWYGPAVLAEQPEVREKIIIEQAMEIKRVARPKMLENSNCVEVNYDMTIHDKTTGNIEEFDECHRVRYLFLPEIEEFLRQAEMKLVFSYGWMTEEKPGTDTWSGCCGAVVTNT